MRNRLLFIKALTFVALVLFSFNKANATHAMGGDLTYVCIGPNASGQMQYSIVAKIFRDCNGITLNNTITVNVSSVNCTHNSNVTLSNYGGATNSYIVPICDPNQDACSGNGTYGVEQYFYRGIVTLPSCLSGSDFVLSWNVCCRNSTLTTISPNNSYLYTTLNNTLADCNSSPAFNFEPTVYLCGGQTNYFNNGITDIDGDQLKFSLTYCVNGMDLTTVPFTTDSVSYNPGFSSAQPLTTSSISIDANTGQITLLPTMIGEVGVVCIMVEEFRSNVKISETIRDLQFTVVDCGNNTLPIISGFNGTATAAGLTGAYSYTGCVGEEIQFDLESFDAEGQIGTQTIEMDWGVGIGAASFIIDDTTSDLPSATFSWTPTAADIGTNFFTVKVKDDACLFNGISMFTYKITVQASGLNFDITNDDVTTMCVDDSLLINGFTTNFGGGLRYAWTTNSSDTAILDCFDCKTPVFRPTLPGTYTFACTMRNLGATTTCTAGDSIIVQVLPRQSTDSTAACYVPDTTNSTIPIERLIRNVSVAPNPFTTNATLTYVLNQRSDINIEVFDMVGRKVGTIVNEKQNFGEHKFEIGTAINQVKGIYFVRLSIDGQPITKKVVVQ